MTTTPTDKRPADVVIVSVLALVSALGDIAAGIGFFTGTGGDSHRALTGWGAIALGVIVAATAIALYMGANEARWLLVAAMIARIAFWIFAWISVGSNIAAVALFELVIAVTILALLLSRETTAFIMGRKD